MRVIAKFIGKNGSMGFMAGKTYSLAVTVTNNFQIYSTCIDRYVYYKSFNSFLKNWEIID